MSPENDEQQYLQYNGVEKIIRFTGSGGGLAPNRRQAINKDDQVLGHHITLLGLNFATHIVISLTQSGLVTPYGDIDLRGFGSASGLLSNGMKPVSAPIVNYHQWALWHARESNFPWITNDINL